jgi:DHA1 family bicyclomycin/chloramphenicol resistance-like MFS transporter
MVAHWRAIFGFLLAVAAISLIWFYLRQPETLAPDRRVKFSPSRIVLAVRETCGSRVAFGYTVTSGLIFGAFVGYLNSAQQVFQIQYGLGELFPLYFAVLALSIGGASLLNGRLVMRHGMRRLSAWALGLLTGLSLAFLVPAVLTAGAPPLWALMAYMVVAFFCIGMLFANFSALAMEPLGHIAGVGAAVVGSLTTVISLILGTVIGQAYDGTVLPLVAGFALLGLAAIGVMRWIERGR